MAIMDTYTIVYIPCDEKKQVEEWTLELPTTSEEQISCLTLRLKQHFKSSGDATVSKQVEKDAFRDQILNQLPKDSNVSNAMMEMMLDMDSLVDSVPLMANTKDTNFIGVNLYVDDRGSAKGLPVNVRASGIVQHCGKMLQVQGDAFIGRVFDNDNEFRRVDFKLNELNVDAAWFSAARVENKVTNAAVCANLDCNTSSALRCSRCKLSYYCSVQCQKAHWKTHKTVCGAN